ncbi:MAG: response regulator [Candidatus Omnitrophica bacterium]|nr:response regulator [Candidatus Omnitrophota bacterium]
MKILIIHDNHKEREKLDRILSSKGFVDIHFAKNCKHGIDKTKEINPDIIVLTRHLVGMDGYELSASLREFPEGKGAHKIVIVDSVETGDIIKAREAGINEYCIRTDEHIELVRILESISEENQALIGNDKEWVLNKADQVIKHLYKELDSKNKKLKELDDIKSSIISTVSHELRTPLSITKESISLILDGILGDINDSQKNMLEVAQKNIERLSGLINNLLDISRIEIHGVTLDRNHVDILSIIDEVIATFADQTKANKLEILKNIPETSTMVFVDVYRIKQVFVNLIANSIKFTMNGKITITVKNNEAEVLCVVEDTGKGIPEEEIDHVFDKFSQLNREFGPGNKGTGLGLSISKELIKMHGGDMWAVPDGKPGTKINFTIPKSVLAACINNIDDKLNCMSRITEGDKASLIVINAENIQELVASTDDDVSDNVLKIFVTAMNRYMRRPGDVINICYPDKIVALLPQTEIRGANAVCRNILKAIDGQSLIYHGKKLELKFRIGAAVYPDDGNSAAELIEKALKNSVEHST